MCRAVWFQQSGSMKNGVIMIEELSDLGTRNRCTVTGICAPL